MSIEIQIKEFIYFLMFGNLLYIIYYIIRKKHKSLIVLYFVYPPLTVLYILMFIYKLNSGKIHLYFIIMMCGGMYMSKICVKLLKNYIQKLKKKLIK